MHYTGKLEYDSTMKVPIIERYLTNNTHDMTMNWFDRSKGDDFVGYTI